MAEEIDDLSGADGARVQPEVKIQRADASSGRQYFPGEMILQHRGLSAWCPSSHPMRSFAQSALVDEDDGAPLREGFFNSAFCRGEARPARNSRAVGSTQAKAAWALWIFRYHRKLRGWASSVTG